MLCTSLNFMSEPIAEEDIERAGIEQLRRRERRRSRKGRDRDREKETKEKEMLCIKLDWLVRFEDKLSKKIIIYLSEGNVRLLSQFYDRYFLHTEMNSTRL